MTALLAVTSALLVGGADFVGGFLSRTVDAVRVAAAAQLVGLAFAVPTALFVASERVTTTDACWAVGSGVAVALGLVCFYTAMTRGLISVVAPVTAVTGALVPLLYALGGGERPGEAAVAGIALAIVAIGLVSLGPMGPAEAAASRDALPLAIAAGVLFGLFYVCFARVHEDAGLWPVAISRLTSATVLVALAIVLTGGLSVGRAAAPWVVAIGALEVAAAVTLLLALQRGPISVASVLASLYPVTTTFLAALVLRERLRGLQLAGVALALVAVALISS
ncbi:DMT family transporter [Gaiella sp.]|uniref:DMT family transporter n=1 Tax=Gaiella sp. TaxID=2663207 RepID=UPI002CA0E95A|nr:DMT family transporter [Gaiella sp.]HWO82120.1 DMT family transporter [Gaiella sp.]